MGHTGSPYMLGRLGLPDAVAAPRDHLPLGSHENSTNWGAASSLRLAGQAQRFLKVGTVGGRIPWNR